MAGKFHGSKAVFKFSDVVGGVIDLSSYLEHVTLEDIKVTDESTAVTAMSKSYVGGYADAKIHLDGKMDAQIETWLRPLRKLSKSTARRAWEYAPEGTASGKPKIIGQGILITFQIISKWDDVARWMGEIQVSGDVDSGTY